VRSRSISPTRTSAAAAREPTIWISPKSPQASALRAHTSIGTHADVVATGNIGCLTQLKQHLAKQGADIPIRHTMQILRDAYAAL
jgi:Fe-S oxidoreductase